MGSFLVVEDIADARRAVRAGDEARMKRVSHSFHTRRGVCMRLSCRLHRDFEGGLHSGGHRTKKRSFIVPTATVLIDTVVDSVTTLRALHGAVLQSLPPAP
ncbi:MAG: hypothetical protein LBQ32_06775, partial [Burkholderiaceae bacterium]|nr:hypothetical protein [Burkholderiaceae bacterium]